MKIDSTLTTIKNIRRRVVGYSAHFHSLGTAKEHPTKDEAIADLARMIEIRCKYESAEVKIVTVRGHVGVFSYNLFGDIVATLRAATYGRMEWSLYPLLMNQ